MTISRDKEKFLIINMQTFKELRKRILVRYLIVIHLVTRSWHLIHNTGKRE